MNQKKAESKELLPETLEPGQEEEVKRMLYQEVNKARKEWEWAYMVFQEAVGQDNIDVAIYTLEAAERRYQIELKKAKQANVRWNAFQYSSYFE
ncbi:DUF2508 family protein [Paenibacillus sp. GM2]|uniref:DUF2508 family protein n=1 Tax=Paenibacillus sp. GM2 TaxID=1622070 RepID=UPI000838566F|nr:DUF2508 family protein [Paenibacillus sp. GM2]